MIGVALASLFLLSLHVLENHLTLTCTLSSAYVLV